MRDYPVCGRGGVDLASLSSRHEKKAAVPNSSFLRFLIIGNHGPSLINFRTPLMRQIAADGHKVMAVTPLNDLDASTQQKVRDALKRLGVDLHALDLARTGLSPSADFSYLLALRQIIAELEPDRILAYSIKPAIYAGLAARTLRHPHFYPMLSGLGYAFTDGDDLRKTLVRTVASKLLKSSFKGSRAAIFQNSDDEQLLRKTGVLPQRTRSSVVSGSGVDMTHFVPDPLTEAPQQPTFLMVCRIMIDKGVREFAEAAALVKQRYPHAKFQLLGALDTANPASPDAAEIGTWTAIDYLGSTDDVRPYLRACHAFVLPSFYREGVPRSALEALAMGRAVVTTDHPGCREAVIEGENGFKVPVRDSVALAEAFEKLILEPDLFVSMSHQSLNLARTRFDVEIVNRDMLRIMNIGSATPTAI